jgi:hypothetical protein
MHPADRKPLMPTVRLFPRLAMAHASQKRGRANSRTLAKRASREPSRDELRSQVRARLLRMIVDNEQVRRNDQRPNAS